MFRWPNGESSPTAHVCRLGGRPITFLHIRIGCPRNTDFVFWRLDKGEGNRLPGSIGFSAPILDDILWRTSVIESSPNFRSVRISTMGARQFDQEVPCATVGCETLMESLRGWLWRRVRLKVHIAPCFYSCPK